MTFFINPKGTVRKIENAVYCMHTDDTGSTITEELKT